MTDKNNNNNNNKVLCTYKKAYHEYEIIETLQAGLVLYGTEIKSLRIGQGSFNDPYCYIKDGEMFVKGLHISKYEMANIFNHDPDRDKKLLLNKKEILRFNNKKRDTGYTIIPIKCYLNNGLAKVEIALVRGKKLYDKREDLKEQDIKRDIEQHTKKRY